MDRPWGKALMARPLLLPLHGLAPESCGSCIPPLPDRHAQVAGDKEDQIGDPSKVHVKGRHDMCDAVEKLSDLTAACPFLSMHK